MSDQQVVPNFFVAGAPKFGTAALSEYLRAHSNVFMSYPKEPSYFADDLVPFQAVTTLRDYQALFKDRTGDQIAVGEASVWYLYSQNAMRRIQEFNKAAKIIILFRNPVDFVQSIHANFVFDFNEDRSDFVEAWNLQEERRKGRHHPERCIAPQILQYRDLASFSCHLERVLTVFPKEQVRCVVFENFVANPREVYLDVLEFLGLPDDGRVDFPRINSAKSHRSKRLGRFLLRPPPLLRASWRLMKKVCGPEISPALDRVIRLNAVPTNHTPLPPEFRRQLVEEFRPDVAKLSRLMDRDLSFWLAGDQTTRQELQ